MKIEICVDNIESVLVASKAPIQRIELCGALSLGGLTPHYSLITKSLACSKVPQYIMIRPRAGDFLFNEYEVDMMVDDIHLAKELGAAGVVIGALNASGDIALDIVERLIFAAQGMGVTFHRAFDLCRDPFQSLQQLISLGCERVLTSGQAKSAVDGVDMISKLVESSEGKISVMAGAGINSSNAKQLIEDTGISELHLSAKSYRKSLMTKQSSAVMGNDINDDNVLAVTDLSEIEKLISSLQSL